MTLKSILRFLSKLILGGLAFSGGLMLGGMIAGMSGLPAPTLPPAMNVDTAMLIMVATSPLLVLALYFVGRLLAGGWFVRTLLLALLVWIAYTLNNVIEAVIFSNYVTAPWFNLVTFTPAVLFCAGVTAWLLPSQQRDVAFVSTWQSHFRQRSPTAWGWRLFVAALVFMPIYYLFGLLVVPFVGEYYRQGQFGLALPPLSTLLSILFVRSILFFIACLPVIVAWRGSTRTLWLSLGFALFLCVGLLNLLAANWIPTWLRALHLLEILADSYLYAGALIWLVGRPAAQPMHATEAGKHYGHQLGFR
ncbi:MAG: hypothetical protein DYG89_37855 [Caldilinea sp. CFX5]|nr:hypothetical protein [Caldilinea sp. CFX5]